MNKLKNIGYVTAVLLNNISIFYGGKTVQNYWKYQTFPYDYHSYKKIINEIKRETI